MRTPILIALLLILITSVALQIVGAKNGSGSKAPAADIHAGYNHSVALCMTIAALHSGRRATFDDAKQEAVAGQHAAQ
ncbi:MAG: hypothetical protein ACREEM_44585 [Blastocatellia bacterium]